MATNTPFELLALSSIDGLTIHENGIIQHGNPEMARIFNYSVEEIVGLPIIKLITQSQRDRLFDAISKADNQPLETVGIRKNGTNLMIAIYFKNVTIDRQIYQSAVFRDVTKRKNIEKALLRSEREYKVLFEDSNDTVYISSRSGRILDCNKAGLDLLGFTKGEILNLDTKDLYVLPEARHEFISEIEKHGSVQNYEVQLRRKDGEIRECLLSSTVRYGPEKEVIGYQGIIRDITDLKKAQRYKRDREIALRSSKMKEEFLANMSHEIRTPLNAIFGITNLLLDTPLDDEQKDFIKIVKRSTDNLLVLVNDILDYSKIEAGRLELSNTAFSLKELTMNAFNSVEFKQSKPNVQFISEIDESMPDTVIGDPVRINQILTNLLGNALKFTESGHIKVIIKFHEKDNSTVKFAMLIEDTGIGITKDKLESIFESFTQVSLETSKLYGGTGLGLTITKQLVNLMGGTVSVSSELGKGSTFKIFLRLPYLEGVQPDKIESSDHLIPKGEFDSLNILVAEDNKLNQMVLQQTLMKWGPKVNVSIAGNGEEAIFEFKKDIFDLVIMDVQMPIMNGLDATKLIRSSSDPREKNTPILAMTAFATTTDADKCLRAGMNDYISKPFDPENLLKKIIALTGKKFTRQERDDYQQNNSTDKKAGDNELKKASKTMSPPIDLRYLDQVASGDKEMRKVMLEVVLSEIPEVLAKLKVFYEKGEFDRLAGNAHKFKSSAEIIGNKHLSGLLKSIELKARGNIDTGDIPDIIEEVENVCNLVSSEIKKVLELH